MRDYFGLRIGTNWFHTEKDCRIDLKPSADFCKGCKIGKMPILDTR